MGSHAGSEITQERFKNTCAQAQGSRALCDKFPKIPEIGTGWGTPSSLSSQGEQEESALQSQRKEP